MSTQSVHARGRQATVPGVPEAADLADLWLTHALSCLLASCGVPASAGRALVEDGICDSEPILVAESVDARLDRLDNARLAVLFAALAVEARVDRLLRNSDATDWPSIAHLAPPERIRLARRLLDGPEDAARDMELYKQAVDLFGLRDELVDAVGRPGAALTERAQEFGPVRVRATVEAGARLCEFLAALADERESRVATVVREAAETLTRRAAALSTGAPSAAQAPWEWAVEFPPDLVGS